MIDVIDNGGVVKRPEAEKIFEKFHQVGEVMQSYRGTGIGLSIASRLVEMHGGQIAVESEENKGSRFVLFLPKEL